MEAVVGALASAFLAEARKARSGVRAGGVMVVCAEKGRGMF